MHNKTKTKLFLVAFMLLSLGWPQLGWSTAYPPTAAHVLQDVADTLQRELDSARKGQYGVVVENNIATIGGVYAVIALLLLLKPEYRNAGWNNLGLCCIVPLILSVWFVVGYAIATEFREISHAQDQGGVYEQFRHGIGSWLTGLVTGLVWPLLMIALGLTFWIGIPLYFLFLLFTLPSMLFVILRFLVRLPILTYHHLHYLSVPHPAETAYRTGIAQDLPMEELASVVADAMYLGHEDLDALPPAWKSKNYKKRIEAFNDLLKAQAGFLEERSTAWLEAEDRFMEELIKHLRMKSQFRE